MCRGELSWLDLACPCTGGWEEVCVSVHASCTGGVGAGGWGLQASACPTPMHVEGSGEAILMPLDDYPGLCVHVHAVGHPSAQPRIWGERRSPCPGAPQDLGLALPCSRLEFWSG